MGKGSRNRQLHQQDRLENPKKYKEKKKHKPMPKWVMPLICIVLVVAVVIGVSANLLSKYGVIKRSRVIVESQTGKYDVTQQMATFVAWQMLYSDAAMYWTYCSYGLIEDTYNIVYNEKTNPNGYTVDQYALAIAQTSLETQLRDCMDDIVETLKIYVAICDEAYRNNVKLEAADLENVQASIDSLEELREQFGYSSLNSFLATAMGKGMRESDVNRALEMIELYNKYCLQVQVSHEKAITIGELEAFRDAHPEDYYKTDYLAFVTENATLAEQLKNSQSDVAFKALILTDHFNNNYKTAYNKFTTQVTVDNLLTELKDLTDNNEGTALSNKLNDLHVDDVREYTPETTENEDLKKWLFDTARKQYEVGSVATDDGLYLLAFYSETPSETAVNARLKFYPFSEGVSFGEGSTLDESFKANILEYLKQTKEDTPSYPEVTYKDAAAKAKDFKALLEAENADIGALLTEYHAISKKDINESSAEEDIPEALRDTIFGDVSEIAIGKIYVAESQTTAYVGYIDNFQKDSEVIDLRYATFEADVYYKIIDDLTTSLAKVYPTDKTASYVSNAAEGSFEAWISELSNKETLTSARNTYDTQSFETTKDNVTSYSVYMVINKPMYLDETVSVNGGYLLFSGTDAQAKAEAACANMQGLTYAAALEALSKQGATSSPTTSATLTESSVSDKNLKAWFFTEQRTKNDIAAVPASSGSSYYVAVYVESQSTWANSVKSAYVTEIMEDWVAELAANYSANEKVLDKLGQPTPEATTATTTAAVTTAAN